MRAGVAGKVPGGTKPATINDALNAGCLVSVPAAERPGYLGVPIQS